MKVFSIVEHFPAGGGHRVSIVRAESDEEALTLYKKHTHRACLPSWIKAEEITETVTEVLEYNDPNYEG